MKFVTTLRKISEEEFKEEEHPRTGDGKFTSKGGGVSKKSQVSKDKKTDNTDRIENVKDNYDIKRMLKAGVQPNEMDLQLAELERKREELGKIKTKRTFKVDLGIGHEETEITGTPEYEKAWKELDELHDRVSKKEEDEYRKSYGWKEGDPFRWTPHNDDPDTADTSGDYGSDYTYKHLTKEESDVIMRSWWNDGMDRKERENKYDYIHGSYINYLNEDEKTPEDLREDLGEDQSIPSDYFFFTDKKTNKQFRGFGMTKAEIKKRAKHGIGSYHEDNRYVGRPDRDVIVYDRPLDYPKFHSKRVSAYNFGEKGSRTDKLWDDLDSSEQSGIKSDYKFDGEFYIGWQEEQEKLFYDWKSKHDNKDGDKVSGKHNELYSEYPELSKQETVLDENDYKIMDKKYPKWREDLDSHLYEDWQKEDKKKELMRKRGMQTYFQQDPIERQKYVGVLFDGLRAYDKDMLAGDAFDYEAPNDPTEDDELKWKDLSDQEQSDVVREVENDADDESPRYEIEETFQKSLPKKDIGFDYDRGIPKPQTTTILKSWANRMENISYEQGAKMEGKDIIIPQYPKSKQRTVKEHEKQVKQLNSKLKEKNQKNMSDKEKWNWQQETLLEDVEEFRDHVRKNEPNLNLDLTLYKMRWDKDDWTQGDPPTTEKEWRKHFIEDSLRVGDKMVDKKVRQLRGLSSLLDQNPKLDKKYQHILNKTDKLNHDNYDLFIKTPEFYRGTSTEELDHYLNHGNTGKMWDWSEKTYPFTALTLDKSSAQSPSEQRIDWKEEDGKLSGGKVVITYEGDSVREKAVPVQYNTQSSINHSGTDASERIGFPYNMEAYAEREVRMNQNSEIPKIKEINFGVNIGKYKDKKKLTNKQKFMLIKKYLPLVGGDKSKIKFYKFVEHALESGYEVYAVEEFVEDEHPRDDDGKFTDKDGSNARVERQKSILQQEIDYLKKSIKEESKKYRPFEKVSDEDRAIRWVNKSVVAQIEELEEELNSTDTVGLPYIPLKPNTHEIETIDNGMYLANSDSEPEYESEREAMKSWSGMKLGLHPLEGFKKGNSTIKVSLDIKEKSDSGIYREVAEKQINLARIMWNSLSDEERDSIHNLTIEKRPSIKTIKNEKGEVVLDPKSFHEASVVGSWAFNTNELTIRIDPSLKPEMIKGTFIHEVGHSMYHEIKEKHPERIKKWKEMVEKIPPTTKYGKYNRSNWKDSEKMVKELDARNWEWKEVVARDSDGNPIRIGEWKDKVKMVKEPIPKEDVEKLKSNALSNIAFYKDLYFNEIHSEVHMYMMGQQKRGHMKKTGKATKGITKFVDAYRLLHDLPKMEEPLVVGEAEEDSPVMGVEDVTEPIGEVVIYLDENFERVLDEDEGEYEFVIELNDDMTIKRYSIRSMWEETATEEFKEEEHPREQDGKFATKGSGSSSGQTVLHKTTHDFLKKWLSDVSMSNTQIFGSIMGKGGLDITYTYKNPDYDQDVPESDDNPKKYTIDSPINNTYKLAKVLGIGIKSKKSQKEWSDSNNEFLKLIDTNPDLNKVFKEYKGEVDGQNKMLQKKYKESKVFYRGTSVDELDAIFGFGEGSYSDTEYAVNHISKWRSRYTFKSLSMNHDETLKMYNAGMMIHFNADTVRKAGRLMDYKAEPTQYLHADVDSSIDQTKIENANTDNPAFLIDEEEVRIDNSKMEGVKIDKIDIYLRGGSRPDGSSSTFDVINKLVNRFGITNNLPKWYELNRMELLGKDQLLDGKKDDKNFERVFAKDPKGVKYVKSIIDRKTGKTYPEIPFKYDKDKLNDHMRNMRTEAKKDMASTVQKDLMENKLFRSKVGDVMVKW